MGSNMKGIVQKDLRPNGFFTKPLFLDKGFILASPEIPLAQDLINRLAKWGFGEVYSEGDSVENILATADEGSKAHNGGVLVAEGAGDKEVLASIQAYLEGYIAFVDTLYSRFVTNSELNFGDLMEKMRQLCEILSQNRRFVLRALSVIPPNRNYLISHAVNTSIVSILVGTTLKMPTPRLMELGAAAALHEIGMVKLPSNLFMTNRQLSIEEKRRITAHTVLGYTVLKELQVPLAVQLAALEHHERVNSTGYPRGMNGDHISLYAKIIAVACSYDAVTAARPHREGKESHEGILDLLRNEGKQYDDSIIKALVLTLSIYPIGSLVMLSNGSKAVVIDTQADNPRFPLVQVLGVANPDGTEVKIKTAEDGIKILRALSRQEATASKG
ncbi:MAG: HD-GYP domain-containing protein [Treponema sp.]|nr:HD-GYP domain-containing protein [Treponema sp.]